MSEAQQTIHLSRVWAEARALIWKFRGRLFLGLLLIIANRIAGLVVPATGKFLVDDVILGQRADLLDTLVLAAAAATLVQAATKYFSTPVLIIAAQRAIADMRKSLYQHVMRLPVSYFDSTQTGILISRVMNDADGLRNLLGMGLVRLGGGLLTSSLSLAVLFYLNWRMTSFILVVLVIFGGVLVIGFNFLRPLARERGEITARITGRLAQSLAGVRIVKAYTAEKREELVFARGIHELFRNIAKALMAFAGLGAFSSALFGGISCLMLWLGGQAIINGTMTLGDFVAYIFFTGMVALPLLEISDVGTQIAEAFGGLDRIRELKDVTTETVDEIDRQPLEIVGGEVTFDDISFEYRPGVPVLKHVSFVAPAGTTTALVGSSGSGKSTLTSLVMSFNRPTAGRLLIDGQDIDQVRLRDYRSQIGIVLQDNFLFDGTIADNIAYSRPHATREAIIEASKIAHCHPFIESFSEGYDTIVGERGVRLSGGQRQRIAIARAILADPRILILDEATSNLDSESEALIQDGLRTLRQGRTTFVIAHRLSTIRSADQILVLEEGEVVERGTHDQLLEQRGRYLELNERQNLLAKNRFLNPGEPIRLQAMPQTESSPESASAESAAEEEEA